VDQVIVRRCETRDAEAVQNLMHQLKPKANLGAFADRFSELIDARGQCWLVSESGGAVIGVIGVTICTEKNLLGVKKCAWLNNFIVDEGHRGRGIGGALLENAQSFARESGAEFIQLITKLDRKVAQEFYENHGFQKTSYRYCKNLRPQGGAAK
jgi:ribosomal protein S18 acetylase RimI-like enzyme